MIVIATNNGKDLLINLLSDLENINPECGVSIIDTQSTDIESQTFLNDIELNNPYKFDIKVHRTPYRGYDSGAYIYAMNNIKADRFYFLQDSIRIKDINIFDNFDKKLKTGTIVSLITVPSNLYDNQEQIDFCLKTYGKKDFTKGIFGPMFSILNEDVQKINKKFLVYPTSKILQMGLERGWAIIFDICKFNIEQLEEEENDWGKSWHKLINDQYKHFKKIICNRT